MNTTNSDSLTQPAPEKRNLSYVPEYLPLPVEIGKPAAVMILTGLSSDDNEIRGRAFCVWMLLTAMTGARNRAEETNRMDEPMEPVLRIVVDRLEGELEDFMRNAGGLTCAEQGAELAGRLRAMGASVFDSLTPNAATS